MQQYHSILWYMHRIVVILSTYDFPIHAEEFTAHVRDIIHRSLAVLLSLNLGVKAPPMLT